MANVLPIPGEDVNNPIFNGMNGFCVHPVKPPVFECPEISLYFAFGCSISYRGVDLHNPQRTADQTQLLVFIGRAIIDVQFFGDTVPCDRFFQSALFCHQ